MTEKKLTHWKEEFNYDYLGAYSLKPGEKEKLLTVKELKKEKVKNVDGKEQQCLVAYFVEPEKPMILNKTNCKIIEKIYGTPHIEDWVGIKIIVYATRVNAWGEMVDALRIKKTNPNEDILGEIKKLLELKKDKISVEQKTAADRVVNNKEERSYDKTLKFLKSIS